MKIGLSYMTQLRGAQDSGQMTGQAVNDVTKSEDPQSLGGWIALSFNQLVAAITSGYHIEHNDDDTHKTIHASGSIYERGRTTALGEVMNVPFAAGLYGASGTMTWTVTVGQQIALSYRRVGSSLLLTYWINGSSLGGAANTALRLTLPENVLASAYASAALYYANGAANVGYAQVSPGNTYVSLFTNAGANWATGSTVSVRGQIDVPVTSTAPTAGFVVRVDVLVVAGGGGGGSFGGGGGGGGFRYDPNHTLAYGSYAVTVGAGGTAGAVGVNGLAGGNSIFDTITSAGGGGGGGNASTAQAGGSGGGGQTNADSTHTGGAASPAGQGNAGGSSTNRACSGGGGAGAAGTNNTGADLEAAGVTGGAGSANAISGASVTYAGGAGGAGNSQTAVSRAGGAGGAGGGGTGGNSLNTVTPTTGTANTGGGGGGGGHDGVTQFTGAAGGTGVVIIRYPTVVGLPATGGTITTVGIYTIHTFTASGTFQF